MKEESAGEEAVAGEFEGEGAIPEDEGVGEPAAPRKAKSVPQARRRKPYNYVLEREFDDDYRLREEASGVKTTPGLWKQVQEGFVSPEQALAYVKKTGVTGMFRVVRVASASYSCTLETPAPVFKMQSLGRKRGEK